MEIPDRYKMLSSAISNYEIDQYDEAHKIIDALWQTEHYFHDEYFSMMLGFVKICIEDKVDLLK